MADSGTSLLAGPTVSFELCFYRHLRLKQVLSFFVSLVIFYVYNKTFSE